MIEYNLLINGFEVHAAFNKETVSTVFLPLLKKLTLMQHSMNRRVIAFLAAPPASGKSTLAAFLEMLSLRYDYLEPVQSIGIDGFHYNQAYIQSHTVYRDGIEVPMKDVKGCPETYDVEKLINAVKALRISDIRWPYYDRRLHDVVEDAVEVNRKIVILEGNWLLLNEMKWSVLKEFCDFSIMILAEEEYLKERLIQRKIRGGLSVKDAVEFYENSDRRNILRCLEHSSDADMVLKLKEDGSLCALSSL